MANDTKLHLAHQSRALFFRSLATMLDSGVRIDRALEGIVPSGDEQLSAVCLGSAALVRCGQPLSHALARYRSCFSNFHLRLLMMGEETGSLVRVLHELADHEESQDQLRRRLLGVLAYPLVVMSLALLIFLSIGQLFSGLAQSLPNPPASMLHLVALSQWAARLLPLALLIAWPARHFLRETLTQQRTRLRQLASRVPYLNRLLATAGALRFVRGLVLQVRVGVRLDKAVGSSLRSTTDPLLEAHARPALRAIGQGASLSRTLSRIELPKMVLTMVDSGERCGKLEAMLERCARLLEEELDYRIATLMAAIEPV
ncbi:MAG: type II secretion system F family protein, partial [Candidatus Eremiobacteraeota bacterium]|nr:type II secretion system F family protein [Candidatus Eremiobacteraeota bacterium]